MPTKKTESTQVVVTPEDNVRGFMVRILRRTVNILGPSIIELRLKSGYINAKEYELIMADDADIPEEYSIVRF